MNSRTVVRDKNFCDALTRSRLLRNDLTLDKATRCSEESYHLDGIRNEIRDGQPQGNFPRDERWEQVTSSQAPNDNAGSFPQMSHVSNYIIHNSIQIDRLRFTFTRHGTHKYLGQSTKAFDLFLNFRDGYCHGSGFPGRWIFFQISEFVLNSHHIHIDRAEGLHQRVAQSLGVCSLAG